MRTQQQFLNEYGKTHRNPTNIWVHTICVPVIFFASFGLLWSTPVGFWLGLDWVHRAVGQRRDDRGCC